MKVAGQLEFKWVGSILEIEKSVWDELAAPLDTPFLEYDWLSLLESSGSVTAETGWEPRFLLAYRDGKPAAACPLYRKSHSEGEFIWDYFWAEAAGALRTPYFPKLVGMSPVTPAAAFQFMIAPDLNRRETTSALCGEIVRRCREEGLAGIHFQYLHDDWVEPLRREGFAHWEHPCYVWENRGYATFEDFLSVFSKNGRRNIRREEKSLAERGVTVRVLSGNEIPPAWHAIMFRYYLATNEKFGFWAARYLTEDFFRGLFRVFRHRLVVSCAFADRTDTPLGMALLLHKGEKLWGRYWGSGEYVPELHFNVCYYAPVRWAITRGIRRFDPGIGGEHKVLRGFRAVSGSSLHRFLDPRLEILFQNNIEKLNARTRKMIRDLNEAVVQKKFMHNVNH
ncbi:MAG: GNAT family N-acetyltransferase [Spirochaetales bacterium]|nr:GNAT family N-acetyltransferase [Spirochaetales bacterium]